MSTDPKNLIGMTLSGRYKIERSIGEGGMGAVFLATQLSLGRRVAVKVVKPAAGVVGANLDEENITRFKRETSVIAKLAHPNIVQVVDAGQADDGTMFLAMELIEGDNMRQVLRRERTVAVERALAIVEDVASALVAAHEGGVIHRDLKAENVMLVHAAGKAEIAKVLDFGVAKLTSTTTAPPVTGSGFVAGTPGCIAPEQMLGTGDDPRSDLYSVGVLLFEMLSGESVFQADSTMQLMLKHLQQPAPHVADVARRAGVADVPAPVDALVASLLAKTPDERPASARALVDLVRGLRDASRATVGDVPRPSLPGFTPAPGAIGAIGTPGATSVAPFPATSLAQSELVAAGTPSRTPQGATGSTPATTTRSPANDVEAQALALSTPRPTTSPTTSLPGERWRGQRGPPKTVRLAGCVVGFVTLAIAVVAVGGFAMWNHENRLADQPSANDAATKIIERAEADLWMLDLQNVDAETAAAIKLDPMSPYPYLLRAAAKIIDRRPLVRIDQDLATAQANADARASMFVQRSAVASVTSVLRTFSGPMTVEAFKNHHKTAHRGATDLDRVLTALKLTAASDYATPTDLAVVLGKLGTADPQSSSPLVLLIRARSLIEQGKLLDARQLLDIIETEKAPGRPAVLEALVDVDLMEAKGNPTDPHWHDAEERLRKLEAVDLRGAIRLGFVRGRAGDDRDLKRMRDGLLAMAPHSEQRIDGLGQLGNHYAALGRFKEADEVWQIAVDDRPRDAAGAAVALEQAALAVLFALVAQQDVMSQRWIETINAIGPVDGPGHARVTTFQRAARAMMNSYRSGGDVLSAHEDLKVLEETPNDIPVLVATVRFHLAIRDARDAKLAHDEAGAAAHLKVAEDSIADLNPCFRHRNKALLALANGNFVDAAKALDDALTPEHEARCTTPDDTLSFIADVSWASSLADRAALAALRGDAAQARVALDHFARYWPSADVTLATDTTFDRDKMAGLPAVPRVRAWLVDPSKPFTLPSFQSHVPPGAMPTPGASPAPAAAADKH